MPARISDELAKKAQAMATQIAEPVSYTHLKRMELGAVVGAAPKGNVVREKPEAGDVVLLLGGWFCIILLCFNDLMVKVKIILLTGFQLTSSKQGIDQ